MRHRLSHCRVASKQFAPHAEPTDPAFFPFSDPDLAGLQLRSDQTEEGRHGEIESIGLLSERLQSTIVEGDARLLLQVLRRHTTAVTNDGGIKYSRRAGPRRTGLRRAPQGPRFSDRTR